jgi:O-antigen/teichoic acid export membrane protein
MSVFFIPEIISVKWKVDFRLLFRMFHYSWPILVLSVTAVLNQAFDKIIFPWAYTRTGEYTIDEANTQLGIYGACVKVALIMAMITQAFRYAYEPIVFAKSKDGDSKEYYAVAMKYFVIFTLFAFLCVVGYLDILKYVIAKDYHDGLNTVPIVMAAEIMMGIYFNLSFLYKLIDKTFWGTIFSLTGCLVLVAVNIIFIPKYGYMACALGGFSAYATAMTLCYIVGSRGEISL